MNDKSTSYGYELILDLHGCDPITFNRKSLKGYFKKLCDAIDMVRSDLHFWDYEGVPQEEREEEPPHLLGTSAIQFITTSNVTIHTLDKLKAVYVNIFSCKQYDKDLAEQITKEWFKAKECRSHFIERV